MSVEWSNEASDDLARLHYFLAEKSERAANQAMLRIVGAASSLDSFARRGQVLEEFLPREVRRFLVDNYELRYEMSGHDAYVIAVFHTREERHMRDEL